MPLPAPSHPVLLCDVGANADCKPAYLVQFARMAGIYAERILGIPNPRIGLLNIGEEEEKGNDLAIKTHALMAKQVPGFAGNAEGRDILMGDFDAEIPMMCRFAPYTSLELRLMAILPVRVISLMP